jgi:hypothetical protein
MGISRNAVRRALARDCPPRSERAAKGSTVDAVEPAIRELLWEYPQVPATTVIAERVGWDRSLTVPKARVRVVRAFFLPPDTASRTQLNPGVAGAVRDPYVRLDVSRYAAMVGAGLSLLGERVGQHRAPVKEASATSGTRRKPGQLGP